MMNENFGTRLQKAMDIRNIKATELSEKANIPKSAISQYLSGLYEAKQKSIFKLAKILDVSEAWLMGLDVPMEKKLENKNVTNIKEEIKKLYGENSINHLENYFKLNDLGKQTADIYIENLTTIEKYTEIKNESQEA